MHSCDCNLAMNAPSNKELGGLASNTPPIVVSSLRQLGSVPHRIEWFGQVLRGTTTSVFVVFAPWQENSSTGEIQASKNQHVTLALPVAYLRLFRIGDIWQNGINTGFRDLVTRETFDLTIEEGTVEVRPAGLPLNANSDHPEYPLPFSAFGGHKEHTHAQCARIALDERTTLVIPCMELIRFYFGGSGSFLKRLFSGAFALDKLFVKARLNPMTGTANIDLAEDLIGTAAVTVARIAFDKQARSAASWIVNSGVAAAANKNRYYPKTTFPFHGRTKLTVDGRWIDNGGHRVFLAEQLARCTHPFPFETLYYTTRRSPLSRGQQTNSHNHSDDVSASEIHPLTLATIQEGPVTANLLPAEVPFDGEIASPFPDLAGKKVCRVRDSSGYMPFMRRTEEQLDLATGEETNTGDTRKAEVSGSVDETVIEELPPDAAEVFQTAVGAFNAWPSPLKLVLDSPVATKDNQAATGIFVKVDEVQHIRGGSLGAAWCAILRLEVEDNLAARSLVVLRDCIGSDTDGHLSIVPIGESTADTLDVQALRETTELAAKSSGTGVGRAVALETERATSLTSVLRTLSLGVQEMARKGLV